MRRAPRRGIPFIAPTVRKGDLVYPVGLDPLRDAKPFPGYAVMHYNDDEVRWETGWAGIPQIVPVTQ